MNRIDEAQSLFDALMDFFSKDLKAPNEVLETVDKVADYLGDIAKGRKQ